MKSLKEFNEKLTQSISESVSYQKLHEKYQNLRKNFCKDIREVNDNIKQLVSQTFQDNRNELVNRYTVYYADGYNLYAQIKDCNIFCRGDDLSTMYLKMHLENCILQTETTPGNYRYEETDDCSCSSIGMVFISKEEYDEIKSHLKDES